MAALSRRAAARICGVLAVTCAGVGAANMSPAPRAQADPGFISSVVGVGADADQNLFDAYAGVESPGTASPTFYTPVSSGAASSNFTISSFDANPPGGTTALPGCITTKLGGPSLDRPNSTTAGIQALNDEISGALWENSIGSCTGTGVSVVGEIDFARAGRGPKTGGSTLTFIPFARDALAFAYWDNDTGTLASLTAAQLKGLYQSSTGSASIDGLTVYACAPISTSALWTDMESALGVTASNITTATNASGCNGLSQNNADAFYDDSVVQGLSSTEGAVIPFQAGSWISQDNGVATDVDGTAEAAGVNLAAITDAGTSLGLPYTGTTPNEKANTTYYQDALFGVTIYTVVPTTDLSGFSQNAVIEGLFSGASSALCSTAAQTTAHSFGEDSLTASEGACGSTTTTGDS